MSQILTVLSFDRVANRVLEESKAIEVISWV